MSVSKRDLGEVQVERPTRGLPYALADHKGHAARLEPAYQDGSGVILYCVDCGENVAWTAYVPLDVPAGVCEVSGCGRSVADHCATSCADHAPASLPPVEVPS